VEVYAVSVEVAGLDVSALRISFVLTCGNNRRCCAEPARSCQCDSGSDLVMLEASNVFE
jgi:hypothetical protein